MRTSATPNERVKSRSSVTYARAHGCKCPGPDDRLGHDLDQRNTRPVVIHERVVGSVDSSGVSTGVRQLSGVLFHVDTFDLHPELPGAIVGGNDNIEVTVETQWLVVLTDLVVLGHVGIEVVLACKTTPRGDVAVQSQAHSDGRFNGHRVDNRK